MKKIIIILFIACNGLGQCSSILGFNNFETLQAQWVATEYNVTYSNGYQHWNDAFGIKHSAKVEQGEWSENNAQVSFSNNDANGYDIYDTQYDVNDNGFLELYYDNDIHFYYYVEESDRWFENSQSTDCNRVVNGTAYSDNCNNCVGGNTGLQTCDANIVKAEPFPKDCDSITNIKGQLVTTIFNAVKDQPLNSQVKDSAYFGNNESVVGIYEDNTGVYTEGQFDSTGANASITGVWSSPNHKVIANHHAHTKDGYSSPSSGDFGSFAKNFLFNPDFKVGFITGGFDSLNYAVTFNGDTSELLTFTNTFPRDSILDSVGVWSIKPINIGMFDNSSVNKEFSYFFEKFRQKGYSQDMAYNFANIVILKYYLGLPNVKTYIKVNGVYKGLDVDLSYPLGGSIGIYIPKICN